MTAGSPSAPVATGFQSLAPVLASSQPDKLAAARCKVAEFDRGELLDRFGRSFAGSSRRTSFLLADELIARKIPPCFWRSHLSAPAREVAVTQRFDLMLYDLRWLRRWYPDHPKTIRYGVTEICSKPMSLLFIVQPSTSFTPDRGHCGRSWVH